MELSARLVGLLLYAIALHLPPASAGICPLGCYCAETEVDCSSLMEFPTDLPEDTTVFKVSHLNVYEIPPYAFRKLTNITKVEFTNCNIAIVAPFAFYETPSLEEIIFDKTVIGNLEGYSFNGLYNVTRIQFSNARIGRIKSLAFIKLYDLGEFNIINTHIRNFYTHGFYNCSHFESLFVKGSNISDFVNGAFVKVTDINTVTVEDNAFWNMHCGVFEGLESLSENFYFIKNTFYCNCSLSWLFSDAYSHLGSYRGVSTCHGPDKMINTPLANVQSADLGCKGRAPPISVMCKQPDFKFRTVTPPKGGDSDTGTGQDPENSASLVHNRVDVLQMLYMVHALVITNVFCNL